MNSLERVLTTLSHKEPDRVPWFNLVTMHGARELNMSIEKYFSRSEYVIKGQEILHKKFGDDCFYPFFYAPIETRAWGGEVIFHEEGPPNSGRPLVDRISDIEALEPPAPGEDEHLKEVLKAEKTLSERYGDKTPIIGVAISPFSLPVMQLGFETYLDVMYEHEAIFWDLMRKNIEFCTEWANIQIESGATAICYFDPVSSSSMIPRNDYLSKGQKVAKDTISRINGPTATHFASGRSMDLIDDVADTGTAVLGVSMEEDLSKLKEIARGKIALLGNLNGIEMRRWDSNKTESIVKETISKAGPGGGFILSDNHGEIPYQVPDEVLHAISKAVLKWGEYPIG